MHHTSYVLRTPFIETGMVHFERQVSTASDAASLAKNKLRTADNMFQDLDAQ